MEKLGEALLYAVCAVFTLVLTGFLAVIANTLIN